MQCVPKVGYRVEPTSHVHLAQSHTRWAAQLAFPVEKIHMKKQYLSSVTQDRLRAKISISHCVIRLNKILRLSTVRAMFSAWCSRMHRVRYSIIWLFMNKAIIFKARHARLRKLPMAEELRNIIKLETLAALSKSKEHEEVEILSDEPQILFKKVAKYLPQKYRK